VELSEACGERAGFASLQPELNQVGVRRERQPVHRIEAPRLRAKSRVSGAIGNALLVHASCAIGYAEMQAIRQHVCLE
jgi:hypothetical protein